MQLWHGGKTGSNGRVVFLMTRALVMEGVLSHTAPTSASAPQDAARCQVARIPTAHLEHLEGKMMPGPPARRDKRREVGQSQHTAGGKGAEVKERGSLLR